MRIRIVIIVLLFCLIQSMRGDMIFRAGMSSTTGVLGIEYKLSQAGLGFGMIPKGDTSALGIGATYYVSEDNSLYINSSYLINAELVGENNDNSITSNEADNFQDMIGVIVGYRIKITERFDARVGTGIGFLSEQRKSVLNFDFCIGYKL